MTAQESVITYEADHVKHSIGGMGGHIFRRSIHLALGSLPYLYYVHGDLIAGWIGLSGRLQLAAAIALLLIAAEAIRLKIGFTIVGQREYERHQISALAWGAFGVGLTFVALAPWESTAALHGAHAGWLATPIVLTLCLIDPLLGECRRAGLAEQRTLAVGVAGAVLIWLCCTHLLGTPLWLAPIMGPLAVAAEIPKLRWIDDNATMVLIPLGLILLIAPFL